MIVYRPACLLRVVMLTVALLGSIGCARVEPWERGNLARPDMAMTPNPLLERLRGQIFDSKEASRGGNAGEAGGCGCN